MISFDDQERARKRATTFDGFTSNTLDLFAPRWVRSFKSVKDLTQEDLYKVFSTCAVIKYGMPAEELLVSYIKKADKNKHGIPIVTNLKEPLSFSSKHYYLFKEQAEYFRKLKGQYGSDVVAYAIIAYLFCVNNATESQASPNYLFNNFDKFKFDGVVTDEIFDSLFLKYEEDCRENKHIDWGVTLFDFGIDIETANPNVVCPLHDDNDPSLSINIEEELWHCFGNCGGGKLPLLISKIVGTPWHDIKDNLETIAADYHKSHPPIKRTTIADPCKSMDAAPPIKTEPLSKDHWAITERGFDYEDLVTTWGCQQTSQGGLYTPWMSIDGKKDGYIVRNSKDVQEKTRQKFHIQKGFKRSHHLFGINHVQHSWADDHALNPVILVEGIFDVVRINSITAFRAVATVSAEMSDQQLQLIRDLRPMELTLAFDNDPAGRLGLVKAVKKLREIPLDEFKVSFIRYDGEFNGYKFHNHNDFGDIKDAQELIYLINSRKDICELDSYISDYKKGDAVQK